jgi:hypothetical protein
MDAFLTPIEQNIYLYFQDNLFNRVFFESPDVLPEATLRFFDKDVTLLELTLASGLELVGSHPFTLSPRNLTDAEKTLLKASSDLDCRFDFKTTDKTYFAGLFVQTRDARACESKIRFKLELRGPVGEKGEKGDTASVLLFQQATPSAQWIINHNLGFYPDVTVRDLGGQVVSVYTAHISINQARVYAEPPLAGSARLE